MSRDKPLGEAHYSEQLFIFEKITGKKRSAIYQEVFIGTKIKLDREQKSAVDSSLSLITGSPYVTNPQPLNEYLTVLDYKINDPKQKYIEKSELLQLYNLINFQEHAKKNSPETKSIETDASGEPDGLAACDTNPQLCALCLDTPISGHCFSHYEPSGTDKDGRYLAELRIYVREKFEPDDETNPETKHCFKMCKDKKKIAIEYQKVSDLETSIINFTYTIIWCNDTYSVVTLAENGMVKRIYIMDGTNFFTFKKLKLMDFNKFLYPKNLELPNDPRSLKLSRFKRSRLTGK